MTRTADEAAALANVIVLRCANGHHPITWSSPRDVRVPCPVCAAMRKDKK